MENKNKKLKLIMIVDSTFLLKEMAYKMLKKATESLNDADIDVHTVETGTANGLVKFDENSPIVKSIFTDEEIRYISEDIKAGKEITYFLSDTKNYTEISDVLLTDEELLKEVRETLTKSFIEMNVDMAYTMASIAKVTVAEQEIDEAVKTMDKITKVALEVSKDITNEEQETLKIIMNKRIFKEFMKPEPFKPCSIKEEKPEELTPEEKQLFGQIVSVLSILEMIGEKH